MAQAHVAPRAVRIPVERSDEALAAQLKGYIDPLREALPLELRFVKNVGQISDEEIAELRATAEEEIEIISRQTAAVLRDYWKGNRRQKVVAVDGKRMIVPANLDQWIVEAPGAVTHQIVAAALKAKWPEALDKLDAERERLNGRRKRAAVLAEVALLDEALLLSGQQRNDLCQRLEAIGADALRRPAIVAPLIDPAVQRLHTSLAAWQLDTFATSEAALAAALRPPQLAVLQELEQPRQQEMVLVQQAAPQRARVAPPAPAVAPLDANRPRRIAIDQQAARELAVAQQEAMGRLQVVQRRVVRRGPSTNDLQAKLIRYVERLVDDIDAACELTESQREKFLLAGKLDIERWREESARTGEKLAPGEPVVARQVRVVGAGPSPQIAIFHAAASYFQRACRTRLDGEQREKLAAARRARREFQRRSLVESAVAGFERAAALTPQQCEQLSSTIEAALAESDLDADDWRVQTVSAIAQLPAEKLAMIFDDVQQAAASRHQVQIAEALRQFEARTANAAAPAVIIGGGVF
ncbi:MAG TPA: hypothetical protein VNH11_34015 [Pirellulales bacterium]|nr:hypothetical protein [Pirellulales bacterium]